MEPGQQEWAALGAIPADVLENPRRPDIQVALPGLDTEYAQGLSRAWKELKHWALVHGWDRFCPSSVNLFLALESTKRGSPIHDTRFRAAVTWVACAMYCDRPLDRLTIKLMNTLVSVNRGWPGPFLHQNIYTQTGSVLVLLQGRPLSRKHHAFQWVGREAHLAEALA